MSARILFQYSTSVSPARDTRERDNVFISKSFQQPPHTTTKPKKKKKEREKRRRMKERTATYYIATHAYVDIYIYIYTYARVYVRTLCAHTHTHTHTHTHAHTLAHRPSTQKGQRCSSPFSFSSRVRLTMHSGLSADKSHSRDFTIRGASSDEQSRRNDSSADRQSAIELAIAENENSNV